jgi:hypothetical protein
MNLQPVPRHRGYGKDLVIVVTCCRCSKRVPILENTTDTEAVTHEVYADLDGKWGDYYCASCVKELGVVEDGRH